MKLADLAGGTVCPICLWEALKDKCCNIWVYTEPPITYEIDERAFVSVVRVLAGKCEHRETKE